MSPVAKWLVLILLIAILITGISIFMTGKISIASGKLCLHMDKTRGYALEENWEKARLEILKINELWDEEKSLWRLTINDREVDEISLSLAKLNEYAELREKTHTIGELALIRQLVTDVANRSKFSLNNVL
jgi:hypothetical protein